MTETQERFLRVIAERVPPERVVELHLFPSIRQGPIESGVAVIAAEPGGGGEATAGEPAAPPDARLADSPDAPACDPTDDAAGAQPVVADEEQAPPAPAGGERATRHPPPPARLTIYTARYRLTIKGPDRGRWEASVAAEADAPLVTLEAVVRGVRHRAGDAADSERLSGEEFRAALASPAWTATR